MLHLPSSSGTIQCMNVGEFEIVEPTPEMNEPLAIAILRPWIDVGRVGTLTLRKLEEHLIANELGRLERPGKFFNFTVDRPKMQIVDGERVIIKPNTVINHAKDESSGRDYLFLHIREPHANGEDYVDAIVALLKHFGVTEYCRIGSMYDQVPHSRPLIVTGSVPDSLIEKARGLVTKRKRPYQGPTSIMTLVGESLEGTEIQSTSLMVHIPHYTQLSADHLGTSRLLEVLGAIYGFPSSLSDPSKGERQYSEINEAVANSPEARSYVKKLEADYEEAQETEEEKETKMPEELTELLRELTSRFENGQKES